MMLVIFGPTATGKTDLALGLANKFNGELISADSRQVYKNLDITSGKANFGLKVEKHNRYWIVDGVKIHGFDLVDPGQNFSASDFIKFAKTAVAQIIKTSKLPIIVGGTGFYIQTFIGGLDSVGIAPDANLRSQLEKLSTTLLYQKLLITNPKRAKSMNQSDKKNPRRLIRAIEITSSGQNPNTQNKTLHPTPYTLNPLIIGLTAPNQYLYKKADNWLKIRLKNGMVEEVKNLIDNNVNNKWLEQLGLECRWLTRYQIGEISEDEATERLRGDIHSFIRRQKTWFSKFKNIKLYDITNPAYKDLIENQVALWYISHSLQANA